MRIFKLLALGWILAVTLLGIVLKRDAGLVGG